MSEKSRTRITNKCRHAEKYIRGEMCHVIHCYPKAYNKYMKDYDPKKEPSPQERTIMPHVLECQQFIWIDNVTEIASTWF